MKRIIILPTLILCEVGRDPDCHPSLLSPSLLPGHAQVITCDLDVYCALVESRELSSKGPLFINLIILFSTQHASRPNAIICVDACFTQKHNQQIRDPPRWHPRSVFIPEADAEHMENYVESVCPARSHNKKKKPNPLTDKSSLGADGYEGPLRVPMSILDRCKQSFLAVDKQ